MSSASTSLSEGVSTSISSDALSSDNVLKLSHGDGPKVLVQPANPPMPVISPEALGITSPPHMPSVQQKDLKVKPSLSFLPVATAAGVKGQPNAARSCTITASSSLPSAITLPVQHYPTSISVPSNITMSFASQVAHTGHGGNEVRIAPPISHAQLATHPKELKVKGGIPLRATQPVQVVATTTVNIPLQGSATTTLPQTSATAILSQNCAATTLPTSAIATQIQSTAALLPIRTSATPKNTLQNVTDIHRVAGHSYTQALKVSTTPATIENRIEPKLTAKLPGQKVSTTPAIIENRIEPRLTAKLPGQSEQKLDIFTDSKMSAKGDATRLDQKLNWPISTSKSFTTKQNMFGVTRGIVTSTAIPITYISKPISARPGITNPNASHVVVKPIVGQPVSCTGPSTSTSVPIPIGVASKILQQAPVPRPHASFPDSQAIFLAGHRQPVSSVAGTVPRHPSVTLPHGGQTVSSVTGAVPRHPSVTLPHGGHQYPYYFYHGDGSFPRYPGGITPYVGHSFTPVTNAGVRQQLNVSAQASLQPSSNAGAAATVAAVARAATVAGGPVRLGGSSLVTDLRTTAPPYTIPTLVSTEGEALAGAAGIYATNVSATSNQPLPNAGSSPRPSILRKRHNDGSAASIRKPLFQNQPGTDPASPSSKVELQRQTASPKQSESLSSSQQSTESNVSESSSAQSMLIKIKQEKKENDAPPSMMLSNLQDSLHLPERNEEPSPRKRQRKQQHKIASQQMLDDKSTDEETETKKDSTPIKKEKLEKKQRKMKLVQYIKRSSLKLLDSYHQTWKPAHNHFQRYTDVKAKDEKKAGIHEIANQRGIIKKTDGWKIKHVGHQLTDMIGQEQDVYDEMQAIKAGMSRQLADETEGSVIDKSLIKTETNRIYELIQGNIQRSKYVLEHIEETKSIMGRLLDHKPKVVSIIKKHANKRHAKKKHAT